MVHPVTALLIGAGQRGMHVYGPLALAGAGMRFVAVAEPDEGRRSRFAGRHDIPVEHQFGGWEEALAQPRLADACVITTNDRDHDGPAVAALGRGYHLMLEKPIAHDQAAAMSVVAAAADSNRLVHVAHVLRYTPFFQAVHEVVRSGRLGQIVSVEHRENVAAWHMAHTFVRGRASVAAESSPMILQKCSHDFDLLHWNLADPVVRLSSVGSLMHFRPGEAPEGATGRCTDGCPVECPFDSRRIYLDMANEGFPVHVITDNLSLEGRQRALEDGPYGVCVYRAGSDVVDHQTVLMETESGAAVTLVMHGHSDREQRTMRYDGSRATLRGVFGGRQELTVADHTSGVVEPVSIGRARSGHGGGDAGSVEAFVAAVRGRRRSATLIEESIESHLLAFAAEEARLTGETIDFSAYRVAASARPPVP